MDSPDDHLDEKAPAEGTRTKTRRRRRTGPRPELLGAIDIGSGAMRMKIAETIPDGPVRVLEELTHPVSTGADSFRHGQILPDTLFSIVTVMENFLRVLDDYNVTHRRAVASSAVREASNRAILVDRIRHFSGMDLEVLDAIEESRIIYQALLPWLRQRQGSYSMALNLGGGSTEIMILRGEDLQTGGSRRLGTSRLFHTTASGGMQSRAERVQALAANIVRSTQDAYQEYNIAHFLLVNRTLYRAFRRDPAAERHERDFVIGSDILRERIRKATTLSPLELGAEYNVGLAEVEVLIPAMMILENFITAAEVEQVTFTDMEMLTGLLTEMAMQLRGENPLMAFRRQMVRSARAVGEQYNYDRTHARVVTEFSLTLFDALSEFLDLCEKDRLLLELAAVLHDVGMYVNEHHHQRHSAYLVKFSDIVGLNEADRLLTSQIVYFHRRDLPSRDHPEFMALTREERLRVSKLAGLLRLADVLDRGHQQSVHDMRAEISGRRLILYLEIVGDMGIIMDELPKKADLLEQVTGLQVILRREMPTS
ncbi:MAG: HD domain-containing protein [Planctomycetaceae bacterium]|nr:HD domain-containing protein [Planctomycetaceae bacterium]